MNFRQFGLALFLALALVACAEDAPPPKAPQPASAPASQESRGVLVAMGDSLTAGYGLDPREAYPALLQARLKAAGYRWKVINAGISGETSSGARSRLDWVLDKLKPDIVILTTGANDGLRGIDPALVHENLLAMVQQMQARGVVPLLGGMQMGGNLGVDYTRNFAAIYPAVAEATGAVLIPFFLEGVAADRRYNLADGIHPNAAGYRRIVEQIYPLVAETIGALESRGVGLHRPQDGT